MEFNAEVSQLVTPNLWMIVYIINHWYQPQIVRSVSELTLVWHFHVYPPCQSCWCLYGWSPEWREAMRSNHCSDRRYWPEESSKRRWKTCWRMWRNWEKYKKKSKQRFWEVASPVQERPQTLVWSLQSDWESWAETCRKPGQRPASSLSLSSVRLLTK